MSGQLTINYCVALALQYILAICNKIIAINCWTSACTIVAVLGQWVLLAMLFALAAQCLWLYLRLVRVFSEAPLHYSVKAIVVSWGMCSVVRIYKDQFNNVNIYI